MSFCRDDEIIQGYKVEHVLPGGPFCERYVLRDPTDMFFEIELLPFRQTRPSERHAVYKPLFFISGLRHPSLPANQGTVIFPSLSPAKGHRRFSQEIPLWEHAPGQLTLHQLVETIGSFHPAQAVETILGVCSALLAVNRASRNSSGNSFPHLCLSPQTITLKENRMPVVVGWSNRSVRFNPHKKHRFHKSFSVFSDPRLLSLKEADTRHDVYSLSACLLYLMTGNLSALSNKNNDNETTLQFEVLSSVVGERVSSLLEQTRNPCLKKRPSLETFSRELHGLLTELKTIHDENWKTCSVCGLMMSGDADLCPLCIRNRIFPSRQVSPCAIPPFSPPPVLELSETQRITSLEELAYILPGIVYTAAYHKDHVFLCTQLRKILLFLNKAKLREFIGDLIREDGSLTGTPYWTAYELAHRIHPDCAEEVALSKEKGGFHRWLEGREQRLVYKKTLQINTNKDGVAVDFIFRGRLYLFLKKLGPTEWKTIETLRQNCRQQVVLVVFHRKHTIVPHHLKKCVVLYKVNEVRKQRISGFWASVDEYRFYSFLKKNDNRLHNHSPSSIKNRTTSNKLKFFRKK